MVPRSRVDLPGRFKNFTVYSTRMLTLPKQVTAQLEERSPDAQHLKRDESTLSKRQDWGNPVNHPQPCPKQKSLANSCFLDFATPLYSCSRLGLEVGMDL